MKHLCAFAVLAIAATITPALAEPQALQGDRFMSMMQSNTLSGATDAGHAFNIYFLPGGIVTYQDDSGTRDSGSWHLDEADDICVAWKHPAEHKEGCFHVTIDGNKVAWEGKAGSERATLRGGVTDTYLQAAGQ
jgi:uncharacterized Zn-binding protein involved in type VI secretion